MVKRSDVSERPVQGLLQIAQNRSGHLNETDKSTFDAMYAAIAAQINEAMEKALDLAGRRSVPAGVGQEVCRGQVEELFAFVALRTKDLDPIAVTEALEQDFAFVDQLTVNDMGEDDVSATKLRVQRARDRVLMPSPVLRQRWEKLMAMSCWQRAVFYKDRWFDTAAVFCNLESMRMWLRKAGLELRAIGVTDAMIRSVGEDSHAGLRRRAQRK